MPGKSKRGRPSQEGTVSSFKNNSAMILLVFKLVVLLILVLLFVFELIVLFILALILVLVLIFLIIHFDSPLSPIVWTEDGGLCNHLWDERKNRPVQSKRKDAVQWMKKRSCCRKAF